MVDLEPNGFADKCSLVARSVMVSVVVVEVIDHLTSLHRLSFHCPKRGGRGHTIPQFVHRNLGL